MKKNSLVMNQPARTELNPSRALEQLEQRLAATRLIATVATLCSWVLNCRVSPREALYYVYGQLLGTAVLWPFALDGGWRCLFLVLFCLNLRRVRLPRH